MIPALPMQQATSQASELGTLAGADGPDLLRYLLVCGFLILVIAGLGWGFRRLTASGLRGRAGRRALQTIDVLPLGGKAKLAVVRCYDKSYLIGIGDKEIRLLDALEPDAAETDEAPELTAVSAVGRSAGGFLDALRAKVGEPARRKLDREPQPVALRPRKPAPALRTGRSETRLPDGGIVG